MTTKLDKTLKREITVKKQTYVVAISPEGLKLTIKGRRNGVDLTWADLVSGEAALATALNASLGKLGADAKPARHVRKPLRQIERKPRVSS